jgi:hypothetical protein
MKKKSCDKHHYFPRSLFPRLSGASWNIVLMNKNRHRAWHLLVQNQTPCEAIISLFNEFTPENLDFDPFYEDLKNLLRRLK